MFLNTSLGLIALTIGGYAAGEWIYERTGRIPVLQPVLLPIVLMAAWIKINGIPFERYFELTTPLHFLLGTAIVALAVPLYENLQRARSALLPVFGTLIAGGVLVTGSALALGALFRLDRLMEISLTTKSVTVPIGLAIAQKIGGTIPLTVISVFTTGTIGIVATPTLLRLAGVRDPRVCGFTLGLTSHAFGIVRSLEFGSEAVAFATLGMTLMGCGSAIVVPVIFRWL
ncbi:MAG: LrgB family protein [Acidobacteriia bacterium]|nr:LrgB family protein [Terriglobia bacterium]